MKKLNNYELVQISGGAIASAITKGALKIIALIAGVVFGIGVIDGYVRPLKCR
ncbi:MAG TPA: class IIb bacteriocin, lactobin A/cerein 7B family [Bacilli bacterium]|nr:class IIb bacteriocin, lactobin A/cerein 7B family [Bacilli bacterium]